MTPRALLEDARRLVGDEASEATRAVWPLAAAALVRQALEAALDVLWTQRGVPQVASASGRAQLLCLPSYIDAKLAGSIAWTWSALSEAGHERGFVRTPTGAEIAGWIEAVAPLVALVDP